MALVVVRCLGCGAGIDVQPDNLLTLCERCGRIYPARELGDIPVHIVPSVDKKSVYRAVKKRMAADPQMKGRRIRIATAEGVYVPLFVSRTTVQGAWKGYRKEKRNDTTVKKWRDGRIDQSGDFPILARKHAREFGLSQLGHILYKQQPVPFEQITWDSVALPVLAVDLDTAHADTMIQDEIIDRIGEGIVAANNLDALTEFTADVNIEDRFILLFPLWTVSYHYRGGSYRVAVGGGRATVLAAMEPVFTTQRLGQLALGAAAILGTGLLWLALYALAFADSDDAGEIVIGVVAAIGGCMWLAWGTARRLIASVNVELLDGDP